MKCGADLDGVHFVDARAEVVGIASERDGQRHEELVHSIQQRLGAENTS